MNLVEGRQDGSRILFGGLEVRLPDVARDLPHRFILGVRPEAFEDGAFADPRLPRVSVELSVVEEMGADAHLIFPIDAPRLDVDEVRDAADGEDESLLADDERALFTARVDARTAACAGRSADLAVDTTRFHYFDLESGRRIEPASPPQAASAAT